MDKLQPLIKHRYWICFGLSVVFVVVGWWMASGAIAIEIEDRMKKVEESFTKATQGATKPNKTWVDAAKKENEEDTQAYDRASRQLLQRQKDARKWPDALVNSMKGISYRQDIKDTTTRARWASIYREQIEKLLEIVKPFKDGEGLVLVDTRKISHKPFNSWRTSRPSSTEIWNCQEDIWLLESLLKSIARVNEGATRLTESQVRQIFRLHLRGGDRDAAVTGAAGGAAGGMGDMGGMSMPGGAEGAFMSSGPGIGGGGMGGGAGAAAYPGKEFEGAAGSDILTEEFGVNPQGGGGGLGGMGGGGGMMSSMSSGGLESFGGSGGMGAAGAAPAEEKRYVDGGDGDTTLGYKTRAFLLDVLIRDDQVPNLLASLTNSDFPVEIVRVEVVSKFTPSKGPAGMTGEPGMSGPGGEIGMAGGSSMGGMSMEGGIGMAGDSSFGGSENMYVPEGPGAAFGSGPDAEESDLSGVGAVGLAPGMMGQGMPGMQGVAGSKGKEVIQAAMNDPLLVHVKIGGLMTLYQSAQEANAEAATAETDQATAPVASPPGEAAVTPEGAVPGDSSATPAPADGATPAEGTPPAEGTTPAEGTPVPGGENPGTPATPAPGNEAPGNGSTPAEGAAPAEGTAPAEGAAPGPGDGTPETPSPGSDAPASGEAPKPAEGTEPAAPAQP